MKPIKKLVAVTGKYTDRNGQEKSQYTTCGKLLARDDGSMCVKIDTIPVGFTGWLNCYDLDDRKQSQKPAPAHQAPQQQPDFDNEDLPF